MTDEADNRFRMIREFAQARRAERRQGKTVERPPHFIVDSNGKITVMCKPDAKADTLDA